MLDQDALERPLEEVELCVGLDQRAQILREGLVLRGRKRTKCGQGGVHERETQHGIEPLHLCEEQLCLVVDAGIGVQGQLLELRLAEFRVAVDQERIDERACAVGVVRGVVENGACARAPAACQ